MNITHRYFVADLIHRLYLERLTRSHAGQGAFEPAIAYARRWLELDPLDEAVHRHLMQLYAGAGQRAAALRQYQECVRIIERELGDRRNAAVVLGRMADAVAGGGDAERAATLYRESIEMHREVRSQAGLVASLEGLANVASWQGRPWRAARLFGAAAALRTALDTPAQPATRTRIERRVAALRA